ncbi:putative multiple-sugar transport system permease YteP [Jeotgalibaca dankookensis]|uniref:Putative multiple-sugar transport system permease YteP n=1 Tax=Jeotgalibaca dankookensis TaxID=708126 RepID=A0A1S6IRX4_9LACT|nr:ABC transporter permease subunit [Jeotgalibaca dankookensis]AQS54279.1 putative multiple-sugar transport system permease YteP [Jeotgalibaca dankookensis]
MGKIKKHIKEFKSQATLQMMIIPGIIFMFVFSYVPIYGLLIAFKRYTALDSFSSAEWVGLDNFRIILNDPIFWTSVKNTLGISFLKLAIGFVIPIILAVMIYEVSNSRLKKTVQTITYLPHFLSWIILGGMLISWLSTNGLLNQILSVLNISYKSPNWLLDPDKYWMIAVLSDIWKSSGWGTILYLASMARIDPTLYEAARIDGATKIRQIWHITLPGISRIISLNFILTISGLLGSNLDQTLVLINSQNRSKAEVINSYVYKMGVVQGDFSYATAVGLGTSIVSLLLLFIGNYITKRLNDNESVL